MKPNYRFFLVLTLLYLLCSCNRDDQLHATETAFFQDIIRPIDLLISPDDMPEGWESFTPFTALDEYCYIDCAAIDFDAHSEGQSRAGHQVGVLLTQEDAERLYNKYVKPRNNGERPAEWIYESEIADQYSFACYTYQDSGETNCEWIGLYGNYIVEFHTWLVPDKISYGDIERIVERIDRLMSNVE